MEIAYNYVYNFNTRKFNVYECHCDKQSKSRTYYYYKKNNTCHHGSILTKRIKEFKPKINAVYITAWSLDGDRLDDFKKMCKPIIIEYKDVCQKEIDRLLEKIKKCDEALKIMN